MCNDRRNSSSPLVRFVYRQIKKHSVTAPILEDGRERERCERTNEERKIGCESSGGFIRERTNGEQKKEKRDTKDERAGLMRPRNQQPRHDTRTHVYIGEKRARKREMISSEMISS